MRSYSDYSIMCQDWPINCVCIKTCQYYYHGPCSPLSVTYNSLSTPSSVDSHMHGKTVDVQSIQLMTVQQRNSHHNTTHNYIVHQYNYLSVVIFQLVRELDIIHIQYNTVCVDDQQPLDMCLM